MEMVCVAKIPRERWSSMESATYLFTRKTRAPIPDLTIEITPHYVPLDISELEFIIYNNFKLKLKIPSFTLKQLFLLL